MPMVNTTYMPSEMPLVSRLRMVFTACARRTAWSASPPRSRSIPGSCRLHVRAGVQGERSAPSWRAEHLAVLHHEVDRHHRVDVGHRVAGQGDDVGALAG